MSLSVLDAAAEAPEQIALIIGDRAITFAELALRVARRIEWLDGSGALSTDGPPIALVGSSDQGTLELVYALVALGQPVALIHPRLTPLERRAVIEIVCPALTLVMPPAAPEESERALFPTTAARRIVDGESCLAIVTTSGTTGRPKGVVLSRRAFVAAASASAQNLGWQQDDRWLLGLPIAHVGGLSILTRCLIARRPMVVPAEVAAGGRLDVEAMIRTIDRARVTLLSLVPTQLERLLDRTPPWSPPAHLRAVLLGGAGARPALLVRAADRGVPTLTTYGMTEACSQVTTQRPGTINRGQLGAGAPLPGVEVRIVDGAIQVRGPTLLSGYLPDPSAPPTDRDGWLATDDLGRFDESGCLHVLGRRSDLVITGGENVHPAEVEAVLEECPGVAAACVFGVPDDTWGELVGVAIVPSGDGGPSDAALAGFARARLSPHRRPRLVAHVEELVTTATGKVDRAGTRDRASAALRRLLL